MFCKNTNLKHLKQQTSDPHDRWIQINVFGYNFWVSLDGLILN
jgi:hypothetical protein